MKENKWFRFIEHSNGTKDICRTFYCPGCKCNHWFDKTWLLIYEDGKPTITPSILVNQSLTEQHRKSGAHRCHIFVRKGQIQFLNDCTHDLTGKTVDMKKEL